MLKFWKMRADRGTEAEAGFTLIEMSIVLVIIGLIIGGVLKGQELIASTRLKATVTQWDGIKAGINGYMDKYNALPGDDINAPINILATLIAGGGNGVIGATFATTAAGVVAAGAAAGSENLQAWSHMAAARLINGITPGAAIGTGGILQGRIAGTAFTILDGTSGTQTGPWARFQQGLISVPTAEPLTERDALEIDRKFDDSAIATGAIQGGTAGGGTACTYGPLVAGKNCTLLMALF